MIIIIIIIIRPLSHNTHNLIVLIVDIEKTHALQ